LLGPVQQTNSSNVCKWINRTLNQGRDADLTGATNNTPLHGRIGFLGGATASAWGSWSAAFV
jgi:hypothetical protein